MIQANVPELKEKRFQIKSDSQTSEESLLCPQTMDKNQLVPRHYHNISDQDRRFSKLREGGKWRDASSLQKLKLKISALNFATTSELRQQQSNSFNIAKEHHLPSFQKKFQTRMRIFADRRGLKARREPFPVPQQQTQKRIQRGVPSIQRTQPSQHARVIQEDE